MKELKIGEVLTGLVRSFDDHIGLGEIELASSSTRELETIPFHCTKIADGSRSIETGNLVRFTVYRHPRGRLEAEQIEKI